MLNTKMLTKIILIFLMMLSVAFAYPSWFRKYELEHKKKYTSKNRFLAFKTLQLKHRHIKKTHDLHLSLRRNSDRPFRRTNKAFSKRRLATKKLKKKRRLRTSFGLPFEFDLRTKDLLTSVKDQGICGGCYCYAALTSLEYHYAVLTGSLQNFSANNCISCTNTMVDFCDGCDGGLMEDVFNLAKVKPFSPHNNYENPIRRNGVCGETSHGIKVNQYQTLEDFDENLIAHALIEHGPVPVGVDTSSYSFELYKSGIMKATHCGKNIDHAVAIVGYGQVGFQRYWIVKNSWGPEWGVDGYFYLERDKGACGLTSYASFPTDVVVV